MLRIGIVVAPSRSMSALRDNLDHHGQEGVRRNDSGHTRLPVGKVRSHSNPPPAAHPHSFHSIEKAGKHELPANPQSRDECRALVLESRSIDQSHGLRPPNEITTTQPDLEPNVVPPVALDRGASPRRVSEKLDARFHDVRLTTA
jgi:hypothetical protein